MSFRDKLVGLIDKPVVIRTGSGARGTIGGKVAFTVDPQATEGYVFAVHEDCVDVLVDGAGVMKTLRLDAIAEVSLSQFMVRQMGGVEDAPAHPEYLQAKQALFEAEEAINLKSPPARIRTRAEEAARLFRLVRAGHPGHQGTVRRLARAHFLATGRYDHDRFEDVTGGDVDDEDYTEAKERAAKLEGALKVRRPEPEIATALPYLARHAGRALARYPNHAELRAWFDRAEKLRGKLSDPVRRATFYDAERGSVSLAEPFVAGEV